MSLLEPRKLHLAFMPGVSREGPLTARAYTLTHSDSTGELFLSIGESVNQPQISGWYTRFMRDEVLAEWCFADPAALDVHCHVSGGIVLGTPDWRKEIFRRHMPLVLEAFRYGDRTFILAHPELETAPIRVHYHTRQGAQDEVEVWGRVVDLPLPAAGVEPEYMSGLAKRDHSL